MADFGCTGRGRFPSAASFLRKTREKRVRGGEEISARWWDRQVFKGEHACLPICAPSALNSPSARTSFVRETRERRVRRGEEIRATRLCRHAHNTPSTRTNRAQRRGGRCLTRSLAIVVQAAGQRPTAKDEAGVVVE